MWASLQKLRDLPDDTQVYCGHEYTLANIKFAQTIEPDNAALAGARSGRRRRQIAAGKPTIPTTIDEEKAANPFLRADVPAVAAHRPCRQAGRAGVRRDQGGRTSFSGVRVSPRRCQHQSGVMPGP